MEAAEIIQGRQGEMVGEGRGGRRKQAGGDVTMVLTPTTAPANPHNGDYLSLTHVHASCFTLSLVTDFG